MLTREQTGGGDHLFVSGQGRATWLTQEQATAAMRGTTNMELTPVGCPWTGNACVRTCAAVRIERLRILCLALPRRADGDEGSAVLAHVQVGS